MIKTIFGIKLSPTHAIMYENTLFAGFGALTFILYFLVSYYSCMFSELVIFRVKYMVLHF